MADKYYAGKFGKVTLDTNEYGEEIAVKSWKASHTVGELDTTSTTSLGKYEVQGGIEKVEGSFEAEWDVETSPFTSGYGISAGDNLTNLTLYVSNAQNGPHFDLPLAFVKSVDVDSGVDGVVKYTVNFVSNGTFTLPA